MNGRAWSAIFMLLVLLAVGLVSAPVLSGEHPWDSDNTGEEKPYATDAGGTWDTRTTESDSTYVGSEDVDDGETSSTDGSTWSTSSIIFGMFTSMTIGL